MIVFCWTAIIVPMAELAVVDHRENAFRFLLIRTDIISATGLFGNCTSLNVFTGSFYGELLLYSPSPQSFD